MKKIKVFATTVFLFLSVLMLIACQDTVVKYTIEFESNGGSAVESIVQAAGTELVRPADPTKDGYEFVDWYENAGLTTLFQWPDEMPDKSMRLYAKWEASLRTLSFDSKGGSSVEPIQGATGTYVLKPTNPTKEDRIFGGWYTDTNCTVEFDWTMPASDKTVYAKWLQVEMGTQLLLDNNWSTTEAQAYTIVANPNGSTTIEATNQKGSWSLVGIKVASNVKPFSTFVIDFEGTQGEEFLIKTQNGGVDAAEHRVTMSGERQTYLWTVASNNLTDGTQTMDLYIFLRPGLEGSNEGTNLTIYSINLHRLVKEGQAFESAIHFNTDGGSAVDSIFALANSNVTAPTDPTKPGFIFAGWYSDEALTTPYVFNQMSEGITTLYAKWDEDLTITVTFDSNGGSLVNSVDAARGSTITLPDQPTKDSLMFAGWYFDEALTEPFTGVLSREDSFTVYAKWVLLEEGTKIDFTGGWVTGEPLSYDIVVNPDGSTTITALEGKGTYSTFGLKINMNLKEYSTFVLVFEGTQSEQFIFKTQNGGVTAIETRVTMDGSAQQEFIWTLEPKHLTAGGENVMDLYMFLKPGVAGAGSSITIKSLHLYKTIGENETPQSAVIFHSNGGSLVNPVIGNANDTFTMPSAPLKTGHNFSGWFTDRSFTTPFSDTTIPASGINVYAKWTEKEAPQNPLALPLSGWNVVSGYNNYQHSISDDKLIGTVNHTDNAWNANAGFTYTATGLESADYSKISFTFKVNEVNIDGSTTFRIRLFTIEENFVYQSTTPTFTVAVTQNQRGDEIVYVADLTTLSGAQATKVLGMLTSGNFGILINVYTGTSSANHGKGTVEISNVVLK